MKYAFVIDWGTFSNQTFVVVGMSIDEIAREMKRQKCKPGYIEAFKKAGRPNVEESASAFVWYFNGATLLWLKDWGGMLADFYTLVHETNHLVFDVSRDKGMGEEPEAQAYMQEYIFKKIQQKLDAKFDSLGVQSNAAKGDDESQSNRTQGSDGEVPSLHPRAEARQEGSPPWSVTHLD